VRILYENMFLDIDFLCCCHSVKKDLQNYAKFSGNTFNGEV
jgi:hypothetical protein